MSDSSAVELAPIREMLGFYCHALTERRVELQDLQQLVDKNIGWSKSDVATSDGAAIFLPAVVERFDAQAENYDYLKVMLTQQAGHSSSAASSSSLSGRRRNSPICGRSLKRRRNITTTIMAMKGITSRPRSPS